MAILDGSGPGIAAALGAPLVMTLGFLLWDDHWKGSAFALNLFKCTTASMGFLVLSLTVPYLRVDDDEESITIRPSQGLFPPEVFTVRAVGFLFLSATIGIVVGDLTWLQALQLLGARRVILMDSLKPFLAAMMGWLLLGEALGPLVFVGIVLTVTGIVVVSWEKTAEETQEEEETTTTAGNDNNKEAGSLGIDQPLQNDALDTDGFEVEKDPSDVVPPSAPGNRKWKFTNAQTGYIMSAANVVLDTYGSLLTKQYGKHMTVWEINLCRFGFSAVVMFFISVGMNIKNSRWIVASCHSCFSWPPKDSATSHTIRWYNLPLAEMKRWDWIAVVGGVFFVTLLTPTLSNFALFQIALALALTLGSVGPLYELPLSWLLRKQKITITSFIGAFLAVLGVVVLVVWGEYDF